MIPIKESNKTLTEDKPQVLPQNATHSTVLWLHLNIYSFYISFRF
jgi:hypothetical protein